jgi:hypothetical protein
MRNRSVDGSTVSATPADAIVRATASSRSGGSDESFVT